MDVLFLSLFMKRGLPGHWVEYVLKDYASPLRRFSSFISLPPSLSLCSLNQSAGNFLSFIPPPSHTGAAVCTLQKPSLERFLALHEGFGWKKQGVILVLASYVTRGTCSIPETEIIPVSATPFCPPERLCGKFPRLPPWVSELLVPLEPIYVG